MDFPLVNGKTCIENAPHFRLPKQKKNVHHLVIFIIKFELPFSKTHSNKTTQLEDIRGGWCVVNRVKLKKFFLA